MLIKEFIQLFRDPRMRMIVFGVPIIQMLVMAWALTNDVTNIRTIVLDNDKSVASREMLSKFTSSEYFEVVGYVNSEDEVVWTLDRSLARVALIFPAGFEDEMNAGRTADFQLLADATDSNSTAIVFSYANQIVGNYIFEKQAEIASKAFGAGAAPSMVNLETRAWFNPNLESRFFYVPSLIGVMLIVVTMLLISIAVVREKEIGTIEQVMVTPITKIEFIVGKTVPYAIIGFILMTFMLLLAIPIFGIHVRGSWLLLYALTGVYLVANLSVALLISTTATTQQQALLTTFFVMLPSVLLSGFIFPIHNMPEPIQIASMLIPLRWYLEILRGIIMKGAGLNAIWPSALGMTILAFSYMALAVSRFKKTT
jgi:ABC-2 type transport system permease protein